MDHHLVPKPWGYEYIAYQNSTVALKVLHIAHDERTSLHCHPTKSTGLVVVDGQATISFIADESVLTAPAKKMIRRGLFHQTQAVSASGVIMLEIETPVDQDDLVRLKDAYGRTGQGYETAKLPAVDECLTIQAPELGTTVFYKLGSCELEVGYSTEFNIAQLADSDIIVFLQGGLCKAVGSRLHMVIQAGDVGEAKIVKQVFDQMDGFSSDTILMIVR